MSEVENFIYQFDGQQRAIMLHFHALFTKELGLTCKLRFKIPFYDLKTWIFYLNPSKSGGVDLVFIRGNELSNAQGILESKGRKQILSITFQSLSEIPEDELYESIQEALILDQTTPYMVRKSRKSKQ